MEKFREQCCRSRHNRRQVREIHASTDFPWQHLIEGTLARVFFRTPPQKLCPMAEAAAGKVVVLDLAHQAGFKRNPLGVAVGRGPAARTAWGFAGKTFAAPERSWGPFGRFAVFRAEAGRGADAVEACFVAV